jgi:hypothetical protein
MRPLTLYQLYSQRNLSTFLLGVVDRNGIFHMSYKPISTLFSMFMRVFRLFYPKNTLKFLSTGIQYIKSFSRFFARHF